MPLEQITAWVMLIALAIYTLLGGADFGAGVWSLLAFGPRAERQRKRVDEAIGPIWEANHVWIILVIVLMFTCFPPAFSSIMTALHVPVTLVLIGIVLRGSAFVFRLYSSAEAHRARRRWGVLFSISSLLTPMLLGVTLGAIATGRLEWDASGVYTSGFFRPWLTPFPWSVGLFAMTIFAYLAAVYLCVETEDEQIREDFRWRALLSGVLVGAAAGLAWLLAVDGAPAVSEGLVRSWWTIPLQLATGTAAIGALAALWRRRFILARTLSAAQVSLIVLGYGAALFPEVVVGRLTIEEAAAPRQVHALVLAALALGALILLPSLWALFRIFKGPEAFRLLD